MAEIADLVTRSLARVPGWTTFEADRAILDNNENPFSLDPELATELGAYLASIALNRYPHPEAFELRDLLARQLGVAPEQLAVMNGSNDVLTTLFQLFAEPRPGASAARVLYFTPSFVLYRMSTARLRLDSVEIPLDADFQLDTVALERALVEQRPNVVVFTHPNNPTGTLWPRDVLLGFVARNRDIVFVSDEAYVDFAGDGASLIDALPAHPNLIITRTLSKAYGLAALRLGYLVASPQMLTYFAQARLIYNVGSVNMAAAIWLLSRHRDRILRHVETIVAERGRLSRELATVPNVHVFPSHANFVLTRVGTPGDGLASRVWKRLHERGVLVRNFDGAGGPLSGCWRVSVGTPAENTLFLDELRTALALG